MRKHYAFVDPDGRILSLTQTQGPAVRPRPRPNTTLKEITAAEYNQARKHMDVDHVGCAFFPSPSPSRISPTRKWRPPTFPAPGTHLPHPTTFDLVWDGPPADLTINATPYIATSPFTLELLQPGAYHFTIDGMPWEREAFSIIVLSPARPPTIESPLERTPR